MATPIWKRCVKHAATRPGHLFAGTVAGLLAAMLWSPLPLVLGAVGSAMWLLHAASSVGYAKRMLASEAEARTAACRAARKQHAEALGMLLHQPPFSSWVKHGALPDYAGQYRELELTGARIVEAVGARPELAFEWALDLEGEVNRLLESYLALSRARLSQLDLLCADSPRAAAPSVDARLAEAEQEIARLQSLLEREPHDAAVAIRRSHVEVLQRRRAQLATCAARDARLAAQTEALVDVFRFLLERVSGADVDAAGITEYLGGVMGQLDEAQRWSEVAPVVAEPARVQRLPVH